MPPKIAIGPQARGNRGVTQHIANLIKFAKVGYETVITPSPLSIYYRPHSTRYIRLLQRLKVEHLDIYGLYLSQKVLPKCDLVHLHDYPYWPELYLKPAKRKAKYVHTAHNYYEKDRDHDTRTWPLVQYQNERMLRALRTSDLVISVSRLVQRTLRQRGVDSVYLPNGVNMEETQRADPTRFRGKYEIENEFFMYSGYTQHVKRPGVFVELARMMPGKSFVMVGVLPSELQEYLGKTLPENVQCLGFLPHKDALDAIAASRAVIIPSPISADSFSILFLEACALNKRVIGATELGDNRIITDREDMTGFEIDNLDDLYEKASRVWDRPEINPWTHREVTREFDWRLITDNLAALYEGLL